MSAMYERKLIRLGRNGLLVTIPKAWANYYGLKPGDKVEVVANSKLTIKPIEKKKGGDKSKEHN